MNTNRLVSTISYNTESFLSGKIHSLVNQGVLEYAHWIFHTPEDDGEKRHAHLIVKPNRRLDTEVLRKEFAEIVAGEDLPRGVLPFDYSKIKDWILYGVHDSAYLASKLQTRKYQYEKSDIHTTEPQLLHEQWREAHEGEDTRMARVVEMARKGVRFEEVVVMGLIPMNQFFQYRSLYEGFYNRQANRGNGKKHP